MQLIKRSQCLMLLCVCSVSFSSLCAKICLMAGVSLPSILVWRFSIPAVILIVFYMGKYPFCKKECVPNISKSFMYCIFLRSLALIGAQVFMIISMRRLSLSESVLLFSTSPIFIALYESIIGKKNLGKKFPFMLALGSIGVIITLYSPEYRFNVHIIFALLAGLCMAISQLIFHSSVRGSHSPTVVAFYIYLCTGFCAIAIFLLAHYFVSKVYLFYHVPLLASIFLALTSLPNQILRGYAYKLVHNTSQLAPLSYLSIVIALFFDIAYFRVFPPVHSFIGGGIIILASLWIIKHEKH